MARNKVATTSFDPHTVKERIIETPLNEEMSKSFLEYAYSVIYARALPDARDGMKPVQRRIIYQMGQMNLSPDHAYMKSARVVGEVMGKLHPHGDSAIYEAMVRLAQPFAMRVPLVDGHGNFGSLDDGPAASRYTEARLASAALGMNADIDEHTVEFTPNYDNKLVEPTVLPAALPNLLVNGASGIAVGMATNMATHNLAEVIAAAEHVMRDPQVSLDELMRDLPGPDWPSGGIIVGRQGIREAYETGRGAITTRALTHVEQVSARKQAIVVTQLPYMVGPERVLERISDGVKHHTLEGISSAIDLTDRHHGTRLVIELKSGFDPQAVLVQLFKHTPLQENFTMNNVALVDGRPHTLGLRALLDVWIAHRRSVVRERSIFRRSKALERLHLVQGLLLALLDIDQVIHIIRNAEDVTAAKAELMKAFALDDAQTQYILDLRLRKLTRMSRVSLEAERDDLQRSITELDAILQSASVLDQHVIEEMHDAVKQWDDPRRTLLLDECEDGTLVPVPTKHASREQLKTAASHANALSSVASDVATLTREARQTGQDDAVSAALQVADEPCYVLLLSDGRIMRTVRAMHTALATASAANEPAVMNDADDDVEAEADVLRDYLHQRYGALTTMLATTTRSTLAFITSQGRCIPTAVIDLPHDDNTTGDASALPQLLADEFIQHTEQTAYIPGEHTLSIIAWANADGDASATSAPLALATKQGVIKRWNRDAPSTFDSWSIIDLKDGDSVIGAAEATDEDWLVMVASDASLLKFKAAQVRAQGRGSQGMIGMKLHAGAHIIAFGVAASGAQEGTSTLVPSSDVVTDTDAPQQQHEAYVFTIAGHEAADASQDMLPGTELVAAKLTPLDAFPAKGRGTAGVRAQRFLKGQDALVQAWVGGALPYLTNAHNLPVSLPPLQPQRDASGTPCEAISRIGW